MAVTQPVVGFHLQPFGLIHIADHRAAPTADRPTSSALVSGITMLTKFAKLLAAYRSGLLAYYDYPISTGPLEGTNNKIKTMKRQAYGFRDILFFKLKIMAIHKAKYALVG